MDFQQDIEVQLREYYKNFGVAGEGPPADFEIPSFLANLGMSSIKASLSTDLELLRNLNQDTSLKQLFGECDGLLERIASDSESTELCRALEQNIPLLGFDSDILLAGISWYTQASQVDPRASSGHEALQKMTKDFPSTPPFFALIQAVQGSLVLRLYVGLVYMRGDSMKNALRQIDAQKYPSIGRFSCLMENELVGHLRNALAHGHIRTTIAGLWFKDRAFEAVASPGFLDKLCIWIFVFYYTAFMVITKERT